MAAAKRACANRIIDRHGVFRIVIGIDHQLASLGQKLVAIARQMAQLQRLALRFIAAGQILNRLQGGLIHNA